MERHRKILFIVITLLCILVFAKVDWPYVWSGGYRELRNFSEKQEYIFRQSLAEQMVKKSTIKITDLANFEWDSVCAFDGYSRLRFDMNDESRGRYQADYPILEYFPQIEESKSAFVFIKKHVPVAVINLDYRPKLKYFLAFCASRKNAHFDLILPNASISPQNDDNQNLGALKPFNECIGMQCNLAFRGE